MIIVENFVKAPTLDGDVINILKQADRKQGGKKQKSSAHRVLFETTINHRF